mmetsp:Transcript_24819/g.61878  ORF Transcript_24819/g.61878 Transcript_24819/m.61878 type:complete len:93 (+) Transcript_24819:328-606(+)
MSQRSQHRNYHPHCHRNATITIIIDASNATITRQRERQHRFSGVPRRNKLRTVHIILSLKIEYAAVEAVRIDANNRSRFSEYATRNRRSTCN